MFKADMLCEKNARHVSRAVGCEIDDRCRRCPPCVLVRSKASWGREKIGPTRRIQTIKKNKKRFWTHKPKWTTESESRTEADVR